MSRPISITSAVTFTPSSYNSSMQSGSINASTSGTYSVSNGLNGSGNTASYAQFTGTTQSSNGYAYYDFNVTGIPQNAVINSVSCVARGRASSNNRGTTGYQLFAGTTGKGSEITFTSNSISAYTLSVGSWTAAELQDAKFRIRVQRTGTNTFTTRFYGATLLVNYTFNGTAYTINATSTYAGATVSPATQEAMNGESAVVEIHPDDLNNITVEDNGVDVTSELQYVTPTPTTGTFTGIPSSYDSTNSTYDSVYTGSSSDGLADSGSTSRFSVYANTGANAESYLYYNFDCSSIPQNANITDVTCVAKASTYCATTCYSTYQLELCTGTTPKGTPKQIQGNGSTSSANTINGGSSWTRAELDNLKMRFKIVRGTSNVNSQASFSFWGATLSIQYTVPAGDPYYTYTITGVSADHSVVVSESIIVPPEEDPTKTYYSVTISSINAITEPGRGTTRVESGTSETITITPSDPQLTLALDNGVDVSSQLVAHGTAAPTSAVTTVQGASYGFTLNSSTGYYVSNNTGIDKSAALCKVDFDLPVRCLVTIQFINYAEATYDFGVFGNIDVPLSTNYYAAGSGGATITDNSYKLACNTSTYNTSTPQTITYEIAAGQHSIYIKYSKDDATANNNDTLQFKVTNIETLEPSVGYYTYDLSNISTDHSLVFIFGNVSYYFITSSTNSTAKLYPDGQMVELAGDTYKLTIVPENTGDTITLRDNNIDVTNSLVRKEEIIEKGGQQITVVNYIYTLTNVQTGHTVVVYSASAGDIPFFKANGGWVQVSSIWKKIDGRWEVQEPVSTDIFDDDTLYVKGN